MLHKHTQALTKIYIIILNGTYSEILKQAVYKFLMQIKNNK